MECFAPYILTLTELSSRIMGFLAMLGLQKEADNKIPLFSVHIHSPCVWKSAFFLQFLQPTFNKPKTIKVQGIFLEFNDSRHWVINLNWSLIPNLMSWAEVIIKIISLIISLIGLGFLIFFNTNKIVICSVTRKTVVEKEYCLILAHRMKLSVFCLWNLLCDL